MNQICKQDPVFQFVGEVIHEIIGTVPLGDPGGTLSLRRGLKRPQMSKNHHILKKIEKIEKIDKRGLFF